MGVFAWFRRAGAATEEAGAPAVAGGSELRGEPRQAPAGAERSEEARQEQAPGTGRGGAEGSAEQVGIPKQQSADGAADSESGEGARA